MKYLKFIIILLVVSSCKKEVVVNLSGKTSVEKKDIWIVGENFDEKAIIADDNTFVLPKHIPKKGLYAILIGQHRHKLILDPTKLATVEISLSKEGYEFNFIGENSSENNLMTDFFKKMDNEFISYNKLINYKPSTALNKLKEDENKFIGEISNNLSALVKETLRKEIIYNTANLQGSYKAFANMDRKEIGLEEIDLSKVPIADVNYNNGLDIHHYDTYKSLLIYNVKTRVRYLTSDKRAEAFNKLILETTNEEVKQVYAENFSYSMNIHEEYNTAFYEALIPYLKGKKKELATSKYNSYQSLKRGVNSPKFELPDVNGKIYSNNDFLGNVVLIDLWATWCSPCIKEFPHLKKLEEIYKGKDIVFIGVSVDQPKDKEKWKKMILNKKLKNVQLIAEKGWESDFAKAYGINGIPRFILLGKDGKIIDAQAPKPSKLEEIKTIIDKYI